LVLLSREEFPCESISKKRGGRGELLDSRRKKTFYREAKMLKQGGKGGGRLILSVKRERKKVPLLTKKGIILSLWKRRFFLRGGG